MKLQNLTVIFIIIIIPVILLLSFYISTGIRTIKYQSLYDEGLLTATHDAIYAFEINSMNSSYSDNAESKRSILKSSIKMFEKSLSNVCGISSYNAYDIEEYIPAIVFGMYDGFYLYSPSKNDKTGKYEHGLKNYVYYSETLEEIGAVIIYSLDNYVMVSGNFGSGYEMKSGYLMDLAGSESNGSKYKGITIDGTDSDAVSYYTDAHKFTTWFNSNVGEKVKDENNQEYLKINSSNDPENENSLFVQHKRRIIKEKMEGVLNSTITSYSNRLGTYNFKMPKLLEEDWEKINNNISMLTFFQGKNIGLTKYNGYCVLNSTNSNEYVSPNLMYFIDGQDDTSHYYHDIRCTTPKNSSQTIKGYKIGAFRKEKLEEPDAHGNYYKYNHNALACYECINASINTNQRVFDYVKKEGTANDKIKTAYWTSLARERYNQVKLLEYKEESRLYLYNSGVSASIVGNWVPNIMDNWGDPSAEDHTAAVYESRISCLKIGDNKTNARGSGGFTTANKIKGLENYDYIHIKYRVKEAVRNSSSNDIGLNMYISKTPTFIQYEDYDTNRKQYKYKQVGIDQNYSSVAFEEKLSKQEVRNKMEVNNENYDKVCTGKYQSVVERRVWDSTRAEDMNKLGTEEILEAKIELTDEEKEKLEEATNGCHITFFGKAIAANECKIDIEIYEVYLTK